jgi:hypothetical protein
MNIFPLVVAAPASGLVRVSADCTLSRGGASEERVEMGGRRRGRVSRPQHRAPAPHFGGVIGAGVQHHAGVRVARQEVAAVRAARVAEVPLTRRRVLRVAHSAVLVKTATRNWGIVRYNVVLCTNSQNFTLVS